MSGSTPVGGGSGGGRGRTSPSRLHPPVCLLSTPPAPALPPPPCRLHCRRLQLTAVCRSWRRALSASRTLWAVATLDLSQADEKRLGSMLAYATSRTEVRLTLGSLGQRQGTRLLTVGAAQRGGHRVASLPACPAPSPPAAAQYTCCLVPSKHALFRRRRHPTGGAHSPQRWLPAGQRRTLLRALPPRS